MAERPKRSVALNAAMRAIPMVGDGDEYRQRLDDFVKGWKAGLHAAPRPHDAECGNDEASRSVCDGMYADRTDEVLGLVEALHAIRALHGGHTKQSRSITEIVDTAIKEHAAWTE